MSGRHRVADIVPGKAYRLKPKWGGRGPGDQIALVTEVLRNSKTQRTVWWVTVDGDRTMLSNYSEFMRRVWAEEPQAIH